jgi:predicted chitinase
LARPTGGALPNWQGGDKKAAIQAIIQEAKRHGITAQSQIAYILATVEHETAKSFQPVREAYFLGEAKGERHRKTLRYYPFYGRGYVQLTWDYNYQNYSTLLGLDLVNQPDLVMRPDVALFILVDGMKRGVFTGVGLDRYINNRATDFKNARRIINGTDKSNDIASLARNWFSNLA